MNAVIVVLFQFWVARKLERFKPMLMMALGTALYGIGFAMYGFTSTYMMFAVAMIVITIGEMVVSPIPAGAGGKFRARRNARTIHGGFRSFMGDGICDRSLLRRLAAR